MHFFLKLIHCMIHDLKSLNASFPSKAIMKSQLKISFLSYEAETNCKSSSIKEKRDWGYLPRFPI